MSFENQEFDDPALRAAVKKAWGSECCPCELRDRLCPVSSAFKMWTGRLLAVAAVLVLGVGASLVWHSRSVPTGSTIVASAIPISLQTDLIHTHDKCCGAPDHHHLAPDAADDAAIASAMRTRLSHAVLMARPADPGWTFKGAAICHVGATPCGHLVFVKGDQAISIFSLPATSDPQIADGSHAEANVDGHPMTVFAKDGAVFCLVGSGQGGSISATALEQMRQRMQTQVTADTGSENTVAELMYRR